MLLTRHVVSTVRSSTVMEAVKRLQIDEYRVVDLMPEGYRS